MRKGPMAKPKALEEMGNQLAEVQTVVASKAFMDTMLEDDGSNGITCGAWGDCAKALW